MSSEALLIDCTSHGQSYAAVICGHLVQNHEHPLGFIENVSDRTNPQGWCLACEYVFTQEQEMTDVFRNFNQMAVVCIECYDSIKNKHNIYPYPSV